MAETLTKVLEPPPAEVSYEIAEEQVEAEQELQLSPEHAAARQAVGEYALRFKAEAVSYKKSPVSKKTGNKIDPDAIAQWEAAAGHMNDLLEALYDSQPADQKNDEAAIDARAIRLSTPKSEQAEEPEVIAEPKKPGRYVITIPRDDDRNVGGKW